MPNKLTASELRVGNWVNLNVKYPIEIHGIWAGCADNKHGDRINLEHLSPIELSPDILLKCFKNSQTGNVDRFYNDKYGVYIENERFYFYKFNQFGIDTLCEVKYLHSLMNLFFALTGHELTIKF